MFLGCFWTTNHADNFHGNLSPVSVEPNVRLQGYGHNSGKKKQHKHKLFGPDFPRTFPTLTPGRPGVKKFLPITGAAEKRTFWCGRPRFSARTSMTRRVFEKLCTKKVCVDFLAPNNLFCSHSSHCLEVLV